MFLIYLSLKFIKTFSYIFRISINSDEYANKEYLSHNVSVPDKIILGKEGDKFEIIPFMEEDKINMMELKKRIDEKVESLMPFDKLNDDILMDPMKEKAGVDLISDKLSDELRNKGSIMDKLNSDSGIANTDKIIYDKMKESGGDDKIISDKLKKLRELEILNKKSSEDLGKKEPDMKSKTEPDMKLGPKDKENPEKELDKIDKFLEKVNEAKNDIKEKSRFKNLEKSKELEAMDIFRSNYPYLKVMLKHNINYKNRIEKLAKNILSNETMNLLKNRNDEQALSLGTEKDNFAVDKLTEKERKLPIPQQLEKVDENIKKNGNLKRFRNFPILEDLNPNSQKQHFKLKPIEQEKKSDKKIKNQFYLINFLGQCLKKENLDLYFGNCEKDALKIELILDHENLTPAQRELLHFQLEEAIKDLDKKIEDTRSDAIELFKKRDELKKEEEKIEKVINTTDDKKKLKKMRMNLDSKVSEVENKNLGLNARKSMMSKLKEAEKK